MKLTSYLLLAFILILGSPITAQDEEETCPLWVSEALDNVGTECEGLERNQVCYGHNVVNATTFDENVIEFTDVGHVISVEQIQTLTTAPLEVDTGIWGIALLSLQANLPGSLPGQNVTFVVFGDTELASDGPPPPTITALSTGNINLRSGPGTSYSQKGTLSTNQEVTLVGRNEVGDWVQLFNDDGIVWVSAPLLTIQDDITILPVVEEDSANYAAPMQAFHFSSGIGELACEEAPPDGLLIQAPTDSIVYFRINGVEVVVGSTGLLLFEEEQLNVNTFDGTIEVTAAGESQTVEPGYQVSIAESIPPTEPETYDYDKVKNAPVDLLPEAVDIPITLPADSGWFDTGIEVQVGQTVTVTATGTVNIWPSCEEDKASGTSGLPDSFDCAAETIAFPDGTAVGPIPANGLVISDPDEWMMPTAPVGSLVGRIGENEPFLVGSNSTFVVDVAGTLQFTINDIAPATPEEGQNIGGFVLTIELNEG